MPSSRALSIALAGHIGERAADLNVGKTKWRMLSSRREAMRRSESLRLLLQTA